MKIAGPFSMQTASDIQRDGLGAELLCDQEVIAEVFRSDAERTLIITTFGNDIPLVVIEEFISYARERLEKFEDGSSLPSAP
ncbi:hypothetical protein CMV30_11005 [Nibricoccus aquaticus]|uniref:Uncharacterized protein n=1 Tax=Nibricoccus aquaticus TaxID=2576891 RepID=A0A290Q716_9BACT|nr:hypothetical protein [Nibricoccus aquaticus]ATC64439.1 hypothetical protein CMV30_11005 [Nibricoccus aquaticus]